MARGGCRSSAPPSPSFAADRPNAMEDVRNTRASSAAAMSSVNHIGGHLRRMNATAKRNKASERGVRKKRKR